jgi:hypothetical protein
MELAINPTQIILFAIFLWLVIRDLIKAQANNRTEQRDIERLAIQKTLMKMKIHQRVEREESKVAQVAKQMRELFPESPN